MKKTIIVGMLYNSIITAVGFLLMITGVICLYAIPFSNISLRVVMTVVFVILAIMCLIAFLLLFQTATLSERGIIFRCSVFKVANVCWHEIKRVEICDLPTFESRGTKIDSKWVVFYTDKNQQPKNGGGNYWNKPPWQVKATKENIQIIKSFLEMYCSNISKLN